MFQNACRNYELSFCQVGGGSPTEEGRLHGMGCLLGPRHVLTARHVYTEIQARYSWPVALLPDGLFRCEIAMESAEYDLMVLRATKCIAAVQNSGPTTYPVLCQEMPAIGMAVGFLSCLGIHNSPEESRPHICFGRADIAFMILPEGNQGVSYALTECMIQRGFSGSPVFRPDGTLIGVFIRTISFRADYENPNAPIYVLPVIAPVGLLRSEIAAALVLSA